MNTENKQTNYPALLTLVTVFFFWGFVAASNGILIPFCQNHFKLTNFESQLLGSAFFGAYFIGSLILYLGSAFLNYDIVNGWGDVQLYVDDIDDCIKAYIDEQSRKVSTNFKISKDKSSSSCFSPCIPKRCANGA